MINTKSILLNTESEFLEFSMEIGNNLELIQGAGGNTSVKRGDILWVKASGYWLRDACNKNIFVPIRHSGVLGRLKTEETDPVSPEILSISGVGDDLKPSIETTLHALMPHRYVIHTHSVNVIAKAVLSDGKKKFKSILSGLRWKWIPYARPGMPLTRNIQKVIMKSCADVLILANHGVVIGAGSVGELIALHDELENRVAAFPRGGEVEDVVEAVDVLENIDGYQWSIDPLIKSLAFDEDALSMATSGILYPDHIVFLGSEKIPVVDSIQNAYGQKVIIVRNVGVLLANSLSEGAIAMVYCLANVLLRIEPGCNLKYLSDHEKMEISGWDAEKYRQKIQQ